MALETAMRADRSLIRIVFLVLCWLGFLVGAAVTVAGFLAPWVPWLEFANQARPFALAGFALLLLPAWFAGGSALFRFTAAAAVLNLVLFLLPFSTVAATADASSAPGAASGREIKVVSFNLYWDGRNLDDVVAFLKKEDADIVLLQEADATHRKSLLPRLRNTYPHIHTCEREPRCDLALLAKRPWIEASIEKRDADMPPVAIWARFDAGGGRSYRIANTHVYYPFSPIQQVLDVKALARWRETVPEPLVIGGDFNLTPWSWQLQKLQWQTGLVRHATLLASWPAAVAGSDIPAPAFPIDHILSTPDVTRAAIALGPELGSDHLPVIARLVLP